MQCIRTLSELEFSCYCLESKVFIYQVISQKAQQLFKLGMNYLEISRVLKVSDKTVKRALQK